MIIAIQGTQVGQFPDLMDQAFRLRRSVFIDELAWTGLEATEGRETDQFDTADAFHFLSLRDGRVAGYIRALPTTEPHLLSHVLSDLCERPMPSEPAIWEMSRYCVAQDYREGRRRLGSVGSEVLAGMVEWAMQRDVTSLIFQFEPNWVLRALQLGFIVNALGRINTIEGEQTVAAELSLTDTTLRTIQAVREHHEPVLQMVA